MTDASRRTLLRAGALGVFAAPLVSAGAALAAPATDLYDRSRFTKARGQTFQLVGTSQTWSVTLDRVGDLQHAPAGDKSRFSLAFRGGPAGPDQGSFTLRRSGFTATPLFVVPGAAGTWTAVVNRA